MAPKGGIQNSTLVPCISLDEYDVHCVFEDLIRSLFKKWDDDVINCEVIGDEYFAIDQWMA
jgi:hypothetical protein